MARTHAIMIDRILNGSRFYSRVHRWPRMRWRLATKSDQVGPVERPWAIRCARFGVDHFEYLENLQFQMGKCSPAQMRTESQLLTWHQIFEFSVEFFGVVALFGVAAIIQFQYDSQHYASRIGNNAALRFAQANTFGLVICPRNRLAFTVAVVHVLTSGTLEHFSAATMRNVEKLLNSIHRAHRLFTAAHLLTLPTSTDHIVRCDISTSTRTRMVSLAECIYPCEISCH